MPTRKGGRDRFGPGRNQLLRAQKTRGKRAYNIWSSYSGRNRCDVSPTSDVKFFHFLWAEGDETLAKYTLEPEPFIEYVDGRSTATQFDALVVPYEGPPQLREVRASLEGLSPQEQARRAAQLQAIERAGFKYLLVTQQVLIGHRQLINNWRGALTFIAACRDLVLEPYAVEVTANIERCGPLTLAQALVGTDLALQPVYLAAIFTSIQNGRLRSDLDSRPLCLESKVWVREVRRA